MRWLKNRLEMEMAGKINASPFGMFAGARDASGHRTTKRERVLFYCEFWVLSFDFWFFRESRLDYNISTLSLSLSLLIQFKGSVTMDLRVTASHALQQQVDNFLSVSVDLIGTRLQGILHAQLVIHHTPFQVTGTLQIDNKKFKRYVIVVI